MIATIVCPPGTSSPSFAVRSVVAAAVYFEMPV